MSAKKATVGAGCYIFAPEMLINDDGFTKELNCQWRIVLNRRDKRKMIEFSFMHDESWSYVHDYANFVRF